MTHDSHTYRHARHPHLRRSRHLAIVEDGKIDRLNEERNRLDALAAKLEEEEKQRMLASLEDPELVSLHELHAPPPDDVMDPFRGSPK